MKKQLRFVLLLAFVLVLVMMTALVASAEATDGAETREEGHHYEVVASTGATPKYYTTLASAVAAVDANGYVITVLDNVSEPAITFSAAYSYTVTGGDAGATITFTSTTSTAPKSLIVIAGGTVTLDNLTVTYDTTAITTAVPAGISFGADNASVVLEDVTVERAVTNMIMNNKWAGASVTVKGNSVLIGATNAAFLTSGTTGSTAFAIESGTVSSAKYVLSAAGTTTFEATGGTFTAGANYAFNVTKDDNTVSLAGATVVSGEGYSVFNFTKKVALTLGQGTVITANNKALFNKNTAAWTVAWNGAEIRLVGAGATIADSGTFTAGKMTVTSGKLYLGDGAPMPIDEYAAAIGFDWSKIRVIAGDVKVTPYEITADDTYNIASLEDNHAIAKAAILDAALAAYIERFGDGNVELSPDVDFSGWIPLIVNNANAIVNITGGEYSMSSDFYVRVLAGTLNISGGKLVGKTGKTVIDMQGGTLNMTGGELMAPIATDNTILIRARGEAATAISISGTASLVLDSTVANLHSTFALYVENANTAVSITGGSFTAVITAPGAGSNLIKVDAGVKEFVIDGAVFSSGKSYAAINLNHADAVMTVKNTTVYGYRNFRVYAGTLNIENGSFNTYPGQTNNEMVVAAGANAKIYIKGGTFNDTRYGVLATAGYVKITGGDFHLSSTATGVIAEVYINGAATVEIAKDETARTEPNFHMHASNSSHIGVYVADTEPVANAHVKISGGMFGGIDGVKRSNIYPVYIAGVITDFEISGGTFIGGSGQGAITINKAGAVLTFSGGSVKGYRNFYVKTASTLNISGGTLSPRDDQPNNLLIHAEADGAIVNISGGTFSSFMTAVNANAAVTVNISGGTFNSRTLSDSTGQVEAVVYISKAGTVNVTANADPEKNPVFNLNSSKNASGGAPYNCVGFKLTDAGAKLNIGAGTFNQLSNKNVLFDVPKDIAEFIISGGNFKLPDSAATLLPSNLNFEGTKAQITGGTVELSNEALIPFYDYISTSALNLKLNGTVQFVITTAGNYSFADVDEVYAMIDAAFGEVEIVEKAAWLPITLNHAEAVITIENMEDTYDVLYLVRVKKGTLNVSGGTFAAGAGQSVFEITGDATVNISGGTYSATGKNSNVLYIATGVDTTNIKVEGAVLSVSDFGGAPFQVPFTVTPAGVTIDGSMAEFVFDTAGTFTFASVEELQAHIKSVFEAKFGEAINSITLNTFIPIRVNHAEAIVTITGGEYTAISDYFFIVENGTLNITGGSFTGRGLVNMIGDKAAKLTISGEAVYTQGFDELISVIKVNNANAVVEISGGTFNSVARGVHALKGTITISGGIFYINNKNDIDGAVLANLYVDGPVKLTVTPNAAGGADPEFHLVKNSSSHVALYVSANASAAEIAVSGGKFGGVDGESRSTMYALYIAGAITKFNISGGSFIGGTANSAIMIKKAGVILNMSGDVSVRGYRSFYMQADATLNISGGSYAPRDDQPNNILVHVTSAGASSNINVTGGSFDKFMRCFQLEAVMDLIISGGTFTSRTVSVNAETEAFIYATKGANIRILANAEGAEKNAVINLNHSETASGTYPHDCVGFKVSNADVQISFEAGSINPASAANKYFDFSTSIAKFEIKGGTFTVAGEGANLLPGTGYDVEGTNTVLENATVIVKDGAQLPIYNYIDTSTLKVVLEGDISGSIIVRNAGEAPYTFNVSSVEDLYALIAAQFAEMTVNGYATKWMPVTLNCADVILNLVDLEDVYDTEFLVKVVAGQLNVTGGSYSASAGESLFIAEGENAKVAISGGTYNVSGAYSYMLKLGAGVKNENLSVSGVTVYLSEFGNAPLQADFSFAADKIVVNGLSELTITTPGTYAISTPEQMTQMVQDTLSGLFSDLTVDITSWVPPHINNEDIIFEVTGGVYEGSAPFFFKVSAGTLKISGGKFINDTGDIIHLAGAGVVEIDLDETDESEGMYTASRIVYANGASDSVVLVKGGRFVQLAPDTANDQKNTLFTYDSLAETVNATLTIDGGYFEATRVLLLYYAKVAATINGGTFVSNIVVDGETVTERPTNAHMLSPRGEGATLTINGGSFDNKQGNYIIVLNGNHGAVLTVNGGSFNGGAGWIFTNYKTTVTINANADPEKNPVFTDTEGYATDAYIRINHAEAVVTVNAGTYTGTVPTAPIFYVDKGTLTVENGTYTGSLFYLTSFSKIAVKAGTLYAKGAGASFVEAADATVGSTNLDIADGLTVKVGDNAFIVRGDVNKTAISALLTGVAIDVYGNTGIAGIDNVGTVTFNSPADMQALIKSVVPSVNFVEDGAYALHMSGNGHIIITGGDYSFKGASLFVANGNMDFTILGGTFHIEGGDFICLKGGKSNIILGNELDAENAPDISVTYGYNVIDIGDSDHVDSSVACQTYGVVTIYNGRYVKEETDRQNYCGALFFFENITTAEMNSLTIYDGYFKATRVLQDYYAKLNTVICGGTFESNFTEDNLSDIDLKEGADRGNLDLVNDVVRSEAYFLNVRGTSSVLTVYGGTFNGALGHSTVTSNGGGGATFNFYGGTFTGGYYWFYTNQKITLNIGDRYSVPEVEGEEPVLLSSPTFEGKDSFTDHGFQIAGETVITITGGNFSMMDLYGRHMFNFAAKTTISISGGTFKITPGKNYSEKGVLQNDTTMFRTDTNGVTNMDITGGNFQAARIIFYRNAGGTLNITDGTFKSNATSQTDAYMIHIAHDGAIFNIYGGKFQGGAYSYALFYAGTATGNTMQLNIYGGTISGGVMWILTHRPLQLTIGTETGGPIFSKLTAKPEDGSGSTRYGIYFANGTSGGKIEIKRGQFLLPIECPYGVMVCEGGDITLYDGVRMESPHRIFQITNSWRATVTVKGGQYRAFDVGNLIYFTTTAENAIKSYNEVLDSKLIIEGGTFTADESSTLVHFFSTETKYSVIIKGGNFHSVGSRMFFLSNGAAANLIVEGGNFTSDAARIIYLDNNVTPMIIRGGTFTLLDKSGNNADNAIIYSVGKLPTTIRVEGGTFIDQRTGSNQSFIKMNPKAEVIFAGGFKLYVKEQKKNFYYDSDNEVNSMALTQLSPKEVLNGEEYFVCFGYYTENAPIMTGAPTLRPVLNGIGITFTSTVSPEIAAQLATLGTVSYGTLIFPTEYMEEGWTSGTDFLASLQEYAVNHGMSESQVYAMVTAQNGIETAADGTMTIRASLINIKDANQTRSMTGIAYAKVTAADGTETYYYATHVSAGVSKDMRTIAEVALKDVYSAPIETGGRTYCYASLLKPANFSRYSTAVQDQLRKFLPAGQRSPKYK